MMQLDILDGCNLFDSTLMALRGFEDAARSNAPCDRGLSRSAALAERRDRGALTAVIGACPAWSMKRHEPRRLRDVMLRRMSSGTTRGASVKWDRGPNSGRAA
jgi:hypothetical protein